MADLAAVEARGRTMGTRLGSALHTVGRVARTVFLGVAAAGAGIFVAAIRSAAEFEQSMAMVQAVTGATAEEFDALTEKAQQLGRDTKFSMTEIASGMEFLGRAGFEANEIIAAMDGVSALAASQMMDLGRAADITSNILTAFGLDASEAERVANVLAATAASANVNVEMLGDTMKYVAPLAAAAGWSLEEMAAAAGKMGDAGIQASMAGTSLRMAIAKLMEAQAGDSPLNEALERLNLTIDDLEDSEGNLLSLADVMGVLKGAGATAADMLAMFGTRAGPGMTILLEQGEEALEAYTEELTGTTAAFDQQAIQLDTLQGQWTILKGSISLLLQTIGADMMPILADLLRDRIIPLVNGITEWVDQQGGLLGVIDNVKTKIQEWAAAHPGLTAAVQGTWDVVKGLGSFIVDVFQGDWSGAWESIKSTAQAALETIKTIALSVWDSLPISDETRERIISAFDRVKDGVGVVFDWIKDRAVEAWGGIRSSIEENAPGIIAAWETLRTAASGLWEAICGFFDRIIGKHDEAGAASITFQDVVQTAFTAILTVVETALGGIADLFTVFSSMLRGDWSQAWTDFKNFIAGIWEGIKNILDMTGLWDLGARAVEAIKNGFSSAWHTVTEWFSNAWSGLINMLTGWMPGWMRRWFGIGEAAGEEAAGGLRSTQNLVTDAAGEIGAAAGEEIIHNASTGLAMSQREVSDALTTVIDGAIIAGSNAATDADEIGENINAGIEAGIESTEQDVILAATQMTDAMLDAIRTRLQTQSPSRVTYDIGRDTGTGLKLGLEDSRPSILATVGKIASDIEKAFMTMANTVKGVVETEFKTMVRNVLEGNVTLTDGIAGALETIGTSIVDSGVDAALDTVVEWFWNAAGSIGGALSSISSALSGLTGAQALIAGGLGAAIPIAIGTSSGLATGLGKANRWISEHLLGQHQIGDVWTDDAGMTHHLVPSFAGGGVVPGPIGSPQLILAHGGEQVTPPGGGIDMHGLFDGAVFHVRSDQDARAIARETYSLFKTRVRGIGRDV